MYFETRERDRPVKPSSVQASKKMLPQISAGQALTGEFADGADFGSARFFDVLGIRQLALNTQVNE